jgi:CheY-like chemotaxis protein
VDELQMIVQQVLRTLTKSWWVIALILLVSTGIGLILAYTTPPTYVARVTYVVGLYGVETGDVTNSDEGSGQSDALNDLVVTFCQVLQSQAVIDTALASLDGSTESATDYNVTCDVMPSTFVLELEVMGPNSSTVSDLANALGSAALKEVNILPEGYDLYQLNQAGVASRDTSRVFTSINALTAIVGLFISAAFVAARIMFAGDAPLRPRSGVGALRTHVGARILVVDDDASIARMLRAHLRHEGYKVEMAHDGSAGLEIAQRWKPHLILLDVALPEMDGFEVCRHLRNLDGLAEVPVIMVTARAQILDKAEGFAAGADDYVVKPFNLVEVSMRVEAQMRRAWDVSKN